jgi:nucleolar complex protein 3
VLSSFQELKAEKELTKELLEVEASTNTSRLAHNQTQILSQVVAIYFRVLKHGKQSPLLPAALEGIGRFTHLIDTAFYDDLFAVRLCLYFCVCVCERA